MAMGSTWPAVPLLCHLHGQEGLLTSGDEFVPSILPTVTYWRLFKPWPIRNRYPLAVKSGAQILMIDTTVTLAHTYSLPVGGKILCTDFDYRYHSYKLHP